MNFAKLLLIAMLALFSVAGCDSDDGPLEKAGKAVDDTADKIGDAATDAGNAVEDACEGVKDSAGADSTNC